VALGYIVDLITFHVWLQKHGVSTFDYVVFERKKIEKLQQLKDGDPCIDQAEYDEWLKTYFNKVQPKHKSSVMVDKKQEATIDADKEHQANRTQNNTPAIELEGNEQVLSAVNYEAPPDVAPSGIQLLSDEGNYVRSLEDEVVEAIKDNDHAIKSKGCCGSASTLCLPCIASKAKHTPNESENLKLRTINIDSEMPSSQKQSRNEAEMETIKSPRAEDDKSRNIILVASIENSEDKLNDKHNSSDFVVGRKSSNPNTDIFAKGKLAESDDLTSLKPTNQET